MEKLRILSITSLLLFGCGNASTNLTEEDIQLHREGCETSSQLAKIIMDLRQSGEPMRDVRVQINKSLAFLDSMHDLAKTAKETNEKILVKAYKYPLQFSEKSKSDAISEFQETHYNECMDEI